LHKPRNGCSHTNLESPKQIYFWSLYIPDELVGSETVGSLLPPWSLVWGEERVFSNWIWLVKAFLWTVFGVDFVTNPRSWRRAVDKLRHLHESTEIGRSNGTPLKPGLCCSLRSALYVSAWCRICSGPCVGSALVSMAVSTARSCVGYHLVRASDQPEGNTWGHGRLPFVSKAGLPQHRALSDWGFNSNNITARSHSACYGKAMMIQEKCAHGLAPRWSTVDAACHLVQPLHSLLVKGTASGKPGFGWLQLAWQAQMYTARVGARGVGGLRCLWAAQGWQEMRMQNSRSCSPRFCEPFFLGSGPKGEEGNQ
jgi:hypothetical protein